MNTVLLDLQYLPSVNWFKHFVQYENVHIERCENFVKSTSRNRCEIAAVNAQQTLSIPLAGGRDSRRLYTDVNICYVTDWQKNHWHSITSAYGSAPFFEYYADRFAPFYDKQFASLFDYNLQLLQTILKALKLQKQFQFTDVYEKSPADKLDLRSTRHSVLDETATYYQVFSDKNGFIPNLSIIDLIFNLGPGAISYLKANQ